MEANGSTNKTQNTSPSNTKEANQDNKKQEKKDIVMVWSIIMQLDPCGLDLILRKF